MICIRFTCIYKTHFHRLFARLLPEEPLELGPRGHGHDEGPVHEPVGWAGHRLQLSGRKTVAHLLSVPVVQLIAQGANNTEAIGSILILIRIRKRKKGIPILDC